MHGKRLGTRDRWTHSTHQQRTTKLRRFEMDDDGSNSSINSQDEALCDVLKLSSLDAMTRMMEDDDDDQGTDNSPMKSVTQAEQGKAYSKGPLSSIKRIDPIRLSLPPNVSRYFYSPHQCCAWMIPNLFTKQECQHLIDVATGGGGAATTKPAPAAISRSETSSLSSSSSNLPCSSSLSSSSSSSFQYVATATHTATDGSQYPVTIPHPNPHKLSVFHHPSCVQHIWQRLQPYLTTTGSNEKDIDGNDLCSSNHPSSSSITSCIFQDMFARDQLDHSSQHNIIMGLNPRLRVLKYDAQDGDEFPPHFDATTTTTMMTATTTTTTKTKHTMTSLITVLLYLNDGGGINYEGGETIFLSNTTTSKLPKNRRTNQNGSGMEESFQTDAITSDSPTFQSHSSNTNNYYNNNNNNNNNNATVITPSAGTVVLFEHDLFHGGRPLLWGTKYVLRTDVMFDLTMEEVQELRSSSRRQQQQQQQQQVDVGQYSCNTDNPITVQDLMDQLFNNSGVDVDHDADPNDDDDDDSNRTTGPTISSFSTNIHTNKTIHERLTMALDELGLLHDTTIESFCSPGRWALQTMLQDVLLLTSPLTTLSSSSSSSQHYYHKKERSDVDLIHAISKLLDAAFLTRQGKVRH
jgi:hypothetical protein